MAGLSGDQVVVDVVAASELLCSSHPAPAAEAAQADQEPAQALCPFGHANAPGMAFCGSCGIRIGTPAGRADLTAARVVPGSQLDDAAKAERERQHAAAVAAAAAFEHAPEQIVHTPGQAILIHFTEDGLTVFGRVWYRGQELEIGPDHPRWPDAVGWITLDKMAQIERWGRQYFDFGPWPGRRSYTDADGAFEQLKIIGGTGSFAGPGEEQLRQADQAEAARGRGVPAASMR